MPDTSFVIGSATYRSRVISEPELHPGHIRGPVTHPSREVYLTILIVLSRILLFLQYNKEHCVNNFIVFFSNLPRKISQQSRLKKWQFLIAHLISWFASKKLQSFLARSIQKDSDPWSSLWVFSITCCGCVLVNCCLWKPHLVLWVLKMPSAYWSCFFSLSISNLEYKPPAAPICCVGFPEYRVTMQSFAYQRIDHSNGLQPGACSSGNISVCRPECVTRYKKKKKNRNFT